jgi:hypothetical protein
MEMSNDHVSDSATVDDVSAARPKTEYSKLFIGGKWVEHKKQFGLTPREARTLHRGGYDFTSASVSLNGFGFEESPGAWA